VLRNRTTCAVLKLNGALGKLGISPDTASKFLSALPDVVSKLGGEDVGKLLGSVLK
jgi:hypothetical protein